MEFRFPNSYSPLQIVTIIPDTYFSGLYKIGGYLTLLGLIKIALLFINEKLYVRALFKEF